jgi:lipid-A-disaccharide synthase
VTDGAGDPGSPLYYLIAGEPSGDTLGAALMRAIKRKLEGRVRFVGIGGDQMAQEGLVSRINIRELAIMGILEVLPSARRILRHVRETVADIEAQQPAALVTIDSSGFCFRVGERLKQNARASGARRPPIIHYVAPMVWAWREFRARNAARAADHLLTLLPFEPPYFEKVGLPASYVGHPVVEGDAARGDGPGFRQRHGIAADAPLLLVLPGSRRSEVTRLLPPFADAVERLVRVHPGLVVVLPTVDTVGAIVEAAVAPWPVRSLVVRGAAEKFDSFAAADLALAASGTVTLELAAAGVPHIAAYRVSPFSAWLLRRLIKLPSVLLVNILIGRLVVPEYLQEACTGEQLAAALEGLLSDPAARSAQKVAFDEALDKVGRGGEAPSDRAARIILDLVAQPQSETLGG